MLSYSGADQRWIVPSTADASKMAVVWGYGSNGDANPCLVARSGSRYILTDDAVSIGDKLKPTGTNRKATVDNAATGPILGVAVSAKGAGAGGVYVESL